jgi:nucleotide-binding universal stress UspA family protein
LGVGLIVLGSRGLGAISRTLIGSVSDSVVKHAHCPVFVVRK